MKAKRPLWTRFIVAAASVAVVAATASAAPWVLYVDADSASSCDLINAANVELVTLSATGELAGVTGTDVIFADTFVDGDGFVFYRGEPAGAIEFAVDAEGFRTLWWLTSLGDLVNVNLFTGEPTGTGVFPDEYADVPCDACPFWDVPSECLDSDGDGVVDIDDLCDFTPANEEADTLGCSCSQLDTDQDGVDDCVDLCPDTSPSYAADLDGCACEDIDSDRDGINECFDDCADTPLDEIPDNGGCSCSQLDSDADRVSDCDDLCPGSAITATVDSRGCAIVVDNGTVVVNVCGAAGMIMWTMIGFGLVGLRFCGAPSGRRRRPEQA